MDISQKAIGSSASQIHKTNQIEPFQGKSLEPDVQ